MKKNQTVVSELGYLIILFIKIDNQMVVLNQEYWFIRITKMENCHYCEDLFNVIENETKLEKVLEGNWKKLNKKPISDSWQSMRDNILYHIVHEKDTSCEKLEEKK